MKNAYEKLAAHFSQIGDLQHLQAIASWDEAAMMPSGGGAARGQALATMDVVIHEMMTDGKVSDWLNACSNLELDEWQLANMREIKRLVANETCLPADLVRALSLASSHSEQCWRQARAANDWKTMQPLLENVVALARESAAVRSQASGLGLYDALLDTYEPGMRAARLDELFAGLTDFLPDFIEQVLTRQSFTPVLSPGDYFPVEQQRQLGLQVMRVIGFDFNHGRLDVSHHPFCGGVQQDVRITTRYTTDNFTESLMAVVHETGHAMYEQGRPSGWNGQPVSLARSSGVHESQSLIMEMQAGRSSEFLAFLAPLMSQVFGTSESDPAWSEENIRRLYTRVDRGLIRVDADELTYPLHVILRYEIERALIEGEIEVSMIPDLWDAKMQTYLQRETRGDFTNGCLQDVHWPAGLFGYFPTYTLGAMMAAQMFSAVRQAVPNVMSQLKEGDFSGLVGWLRQHVHSNGSLYSVDELMQRATGETLNSQYFLQHLKRRYG